MLKAISEISVPKSVEKPVTDSQQGGEKKGAEQTDPKDSETEKESTSKQPKKQKQKQITKPTPKRPIIKGVVIKPVEGSSTQKLKSKEPETEGKGKGIATTEEPNPKATPNTSKDEELARKLEEEERQKASQLREKKQIEHSEIRIWPVWTKARITKFALPAADPYWLHPIASESIAVDANF